MGRRQPPRPHSEPIVEPRGPKGSLTFLTASDRWYGRNNRDFQRCFHRCWKLPDDIDASKDSIEEAYREWVSRGSPTGGNCYGGGDGERVRYLVRRLIAKDHIPAVPTPENIRLIRDLAAAGTVGTAILAVYVIVVVSATPK